MDAAFLLYQETILPKLQLLIEFTLIYYKELKSKALPLPFFSKEPLNIFVFYTLFLIILFKIVFPLLKWCFSLSFGSVKRSFIRFLTQCIPSVKRKLLESRQKTEKEVFSELSKHDTNQTYKLPKNGMKLSTLNDRMSFWLKRDEVAINTGKISGAKYSNDPDYERNLKEFIKDFFFHNPLHFDIYAGARQMEAELLSMTGILLGCEKDHVYGSTTSGGTESNMMAIYTYRQWGLEVKNITKPEIIVPETAHASFYKAAHFYNVKVITLPTKPRSGTIEISALRRAISKNTVCIVGSVPNYPHGNCDPIEEMAKVALKYNVGLHVDACLGGFLTIFAQENQIKIPKFDFKVPGVTSISIDHHKYGLANKGISSIFYNSKELRHYQYFSTSSWPGGIYATPCAPGSRSGAPIAGAWFAMVYNGYNGYKENAKKIFETTRKFREKIESIKELKVIGDPKICVVAFASNNKNLNIYALHEILLQKGWNLGALNYPACIHITITLANEKSLNDLVKEIQNAIEVIKNDPTKNKVGIMGTIYGTTKKVPDTQTADEFMKVVLDASLKI